MAITADPKHSAPSKPGINSALEAQFPKSDHSKVYWVFFSVVGEMVKQIFNYTLLPLAKIFIIAPLLLIRELTSAIYFLALKALGVDIKDSAGNKPVLAPRGKERSSSLTDDSDDTSSIGSLSSRGPHTAPSSNPRRSSASLPTAPLALTNSDPSVNPNNCWANSGLQLIMHSPSLFTLFLNNVADLSEEMAFIKDEADLDLKAAKIRAMKVLKKEIEDMVALFFKSSERGVIREANAASIREFLSTWDPASFDPSVYLPIPEDPTILSHRMFDASEAFFALLFAWSEQKIGKGRFENVTYERVSDEAVDADPGVAIRLTPELTAEREPQNDVSRFEIDLPYGEEPRFEVLLEKVFEETVTASEEDLRLGYIDSSDAATPVLHRYKPVKVARPLDSLPDVLLLNINRTVARRNEAGEIVYLSPGIYETSKDNRPLADIPLRMVAKPHWSMSREESVYELKGFICHWGDTLNTGHYVAYVLRDGKWWKCNDNRLEEVEDISFVLRTETTTLHVYEKISDDILSKVVKG